MTNNETNELTKALIKRIRALVDTYDSQSEFGRETELTRSTVSAIVNERIENLSFVVIRKIIEGTGCSERWLVSGSGPMFPSGTQSAQAARAEAQRVEQLLANHIDGEDQPSGPEGTLSEARAKEMLIVIRSLIDNFLAQEQ